MIKSTSIEHITNEYRRIQSRYIFMGESNPPLSPSKEVNVEEKTEAVFAQNEGCITSDYARWVSNTREYLIKNPSNLRALSEALYPRDENILDRKNFITLMKHIY